MRLSLIIIFALLSVWAVYLLVSAYLDYRRKQERPAMKQLASHHNVTVLEPEPRDWKVDWPEYESE